MNETKLNVWNIDEQLCAGRVVKIYGEINTHMALQVTSYIDVLSSDDPSAVIKIEICSGGGSVLDGNAIVDKIREIPNPVVCYIKGLAASMATVIAAACDYVFISENAHTMIHELSSGTQGKFREMKNAVEFDEKLNRKLMTFLGKKCKNRTYDEIMDIALRDFWQDAKETVEFGLADAIVPETKKNDKSLKEYLKAVSGK